MAQTKIKSEALVRNSRGAAVTEYLLLLSFILFAGTLALKQLQVASSGVFGAATAQLQDTSISLARGGGSGGTTPGLGQGVECAGSCVRNRAVDDVLSDP